MKKIALAAGITLLTSLTAVAQPAPGTPRADQREANMEQRIQQGVQSGQLTPREAQRVERGQDRIDRMEDRAKADGVVTGKEKARIEHAQNVESRQLYREKHDRQRDLNHDGRRDHHRPHPQRRPHRG